MELFKEIKNRISALETKIDEFKYDVDEVNYNNTRIENHIKDLDKQLDEVINIMCEISMEPRIKLGNRRKMEGYLVRTLAIYDAKSNRHLANIECADDIKRVVNALYGEEDK